MTNDLIEEPAPTENPPTPTPKDVAGIPHSRITMLPSVKGNKGLTPKVDDSFLEVCDHLEDVLDVIGATPPDVAPLQVVVRCAPLPKDRQREIFARFLKWDTAHAICPDGGGGRVFVHFGNRPQLRVEFQATAVAAQHFEFQQVSKWHIDKRLLPDWVDPEKGLL